MLLHTTSTQSTAAVCVSSSVAAPSPSATRCPVIQPRPAKTTAQMSPQCPNCPFRSASFRQRALRDLARRVCAALPACVALEDKLPRDPQAWRHGGTLLLRLCPNSSSLGSIHSTTPMAAMLHAPPLQPTMTVTQSHMPAPSPLVASHAQHRTMV